MWWGNFNLITFISLFLGQAVASIQEDGYWDYITGTLPVPRMAVNVTGNVHSSGYIFLTTRGAQINRMSTLIYDQEGDLVYQGPQSVTSNLHVQTVFGQDMLTLWSGHMISIGIGYGAVSMLDNTYRRLYTITLTGHFVTPDGIQRSSYIDFHESEVTPQNTLLVTAYNVTNANLTSVGGPEDGWLLDSLFYDIDIATNRVLFSWSAFDFLKEIPLCTSHHPLGESGKNRSDPWDAYHVNSIQAVNDGYLISIRHMWSGIYLYRNGTVKWQLNVSFLS
jgi:hypothetical protein